VGRSGLPNYRKLAFERYPAICVHCGFGIEPVLEVAHLDGSAQNCSVENLAILCPTCHRMHDIGLIPTEHLIAMRDVERQADWGLLMKDAAAKAVATKLADDPEHFKRAAQKATATRRAREQSEDAD